MSVRSGRVGSFSGGFGSDFKGRICVIRRYFATAPCSGRIAVLKGISTERRGIYPLN